MNKLSYGLLSFLSTEPLSGYDLMLRLNQFWRTTHSAIYPLLSELEDSGHITHTLIEQSSKPDKKIYNITERGINILKKWLLSATDAAVIRDELMLKVYCIQILDDIAARKLIDEIEDRYIKKLDESSKSLEKLRTANSSKFGTYILIQKVIGECRLGIEWCHWIRSLYDKGENINIFNENFKRILD